VLAVLFPVSWMVHWNPLHTRLSKAEAV
jgi:hypothetical protein